jgi:heavy metal sensor kinase
MRAALASLRVRLALWYALSLGGALLAYAVGTSMFLRTSLLDELDHQLYDHLDFARHMLARRPTGELVWEGTDPAHDGEAAWWMIVRDGHSAIVFTLGHVEPDAMTTRHLSDRFDIGGELFDVEVAKSLVPMGRRLAQLRTIMLLGLPFGMAAAGLGGFLLARRALAPVGVMAARARAITAENLSERLPVDTASGELAELAGVFNDTLARLQRSFEQLRRFTADASHELRTPLTAIRSVGEVSLREARDAGAHRDAIASMLEEADRMARLVESLLMLSRADAGRVILHREPVDLVDLARRVVAQLGVLAEEKNQRLTVESTENLVILGDPLVIRQGLTNIVHNAIQHSPDGAPVRIRVRRMGDAAVMEVVDAGPGIAAEHRARIFDRFYRVDRARSRDTGGVGLGLSIARWTMQAHGGDIEIETAAGAGSTFRLVLPATNAMAADVSVDPISASRRRDS